MCRGRAGRGGGWWGGAWTMLSTVTADVSGEVAPMRLLKPSASPSFLTASPVPESGSFFSNTGKAGAKGKRRHMFGNDGSGRR